MEFRTLHIAEPILRALHDEGYRTPTPIQAQAIPIVLQGKDLLGVAQTGTGKTAAFSVPILQLLDARTEPASSVQIQRSVERPQEGNRNQPRRPQIQSKRKPIRSLILTPTRELAIQIDDSIKAYGRHLQLTSAVIFGGVSQGAQTNALRRGVDIVVATPGRLLDLMDQGFVHLDHVEIFVLDEADRMLDMGFVRDVHKIIEQLPTKRQSLFFSATMPPAIVTLAKAILHDPQRVEVTPVSSTVDLIEQYLFHVEKGKKLALLMQVIDDYNMPTVLVFTRTKHGADNVVRTLSRNNIKAEAIHGNKAQNARQRALANFKSQQTRVLVATDIAARGIDVDDLEYVINFEIPNVPETYVHRIGRTGRAGAAGCALSFCSPDEKAYVRDVEKLIKKRIPVVYDHPFAKPEGAREQGAPENKDQNRRERHQERKGSPQRDGGRPKAGGGGQRGSGKPARSGSSSSGLRPAAASSSPRSGGTRSDSPRSSAPRSDSPRSSAPRSGAPKKKVEHGKSRRAPKSPRH